jgi:hypothetical protein
MNKKLLLPLILSFSVNAHALTIEQFAALADGEYRKATTMYLGGVNDTVRIFSFYGNEDCTEWKVLSPNQFLAAFEAHYPNIEDKQKLISMWAFEYALMNGGCAD